VKGHGRRPGARLRTVSIELKWIFERRDRDKFKRERSRQAETDVVRCETSGKCNSRRRSDAFWWGFGGRANRRKIYFCAKRASDATRAQKSKCSVQVSAFDGGKADKDDVS
jgi:hypothetical protein